MKMSADHARIISEAHQHLERLRNMPEPPPRDPLAEDALEKWARSMPPKPEPEIDSGVSPGRHRNERSTSIAPPVDWAAEIERAIEAAIMDELERSHPLLASFSPHRTRAASGDR